MSAISLTGSYDYRLVFLSVAIAMLASYAALDLGGRVTNARGRARLAWLGGGAFAMGIGIWSMHYIGMLAFRLPVPVEYDWPTVLLSLLCAVIASGLALFIVSRDAMTLAEAGVGGILMGAGIACMHYIGMDAMRLPAMCSYAPALVAFSVVLACVISFVALFLTFSLRSQTTTWTWEKLVCSMVMGTAIPTMHYSGMAAVSFWPAPLDRMRLSHAVGTSELGVSCIVLATLIILGLVFVTAMVDRKFFHQALELEASEHRYRLIVETASDAFLSTDAFDRITEWNAQAERLFGWSHAEALGRALSTIIVLSGDVDEGHTLNARFGAGTAHSFPERIEAVGVCRDRMQFPIEMTISTVVTGQKRTFAAFVHDVTERRVLEGEREKAKLAAEAASRAKSEFLANMSHEIRTPLNGVIGMTDLLLESNLTHEQRDYLETVKLSADSLLTVINDVLDFSRIEAGRLELQPENFDLRHCLETTLKTLALKANEKGIELLCDFAADLPPTVLADAIRLRQVVTNIVGNAVKFTQQGEVTLKAFVDEQNGNQESLHFIVSDTGIGIAEAKQKMIFKAFQQADTTTTREFGGSGLGLTISRRLVEMMGGTLWVESELGRGSHFHFTIRATVASASLLPIEGPPAFDVLSDVKVLIVDDNKTNRRILDGLLTHWKMKTKCVEDGEQALLELQAAVDQGEPYALILTDMHMPRMDGFDLVKKIRHSNELATAIIMMITSGAHQNDAQRCEQLGIAAYLQKPIRQVELKESLVQVLSGPSDPGSDLTTTSNILNNRQSPQVHLRILLAEDNSVNQLVSTRMLEKRGHQVTAANNGRETLDQLDKGEFDLVFMDIHMPEMDGIEATMALRRKEVASHEHQPIIALTAMAMKGDRDRCLNAGMDGYLSKPINQQELDAILESHLEKKRRNPRPSVSIRNASVLNEAELMERIDGDVEFLSELAELFREEGPRQLAMLREALSQRDAQAVQQAGHKLKGSLASLSALGPCSAAATVEQSGASGDLALADRLFTQLEEDIPFVLASLNNLCKERSR